jgi:hypothetical protein
MHSQVYLISSLIVFGVQAIALTDAKFPVWYPYYGTWFIGICVELTLLILPNVYSPPNATFDYVVIATQCFRVVTLLLLVSLFFGPRSDKKEYDNADAEQQSLLKNGKPGGSEDSAKGYGTASGTTTSAISVAASEDSWVAKQRKAQELIEKRLQQDGNWFTYAKGFAVSFFRFLLRDKDVLICARFSFHTSGPCIERASRLELSLWGFVFW